ncbi:hypothetical protein Efla_007814 [Eimeria flavescens]
MQRSPRPPSVHTPGAGGPGGPDQLGPPPVSLPAAAPAGRGRPKRARLGQPSRGLLMGSGGGGSGPVVSAAAEEETRGEAEDACIAFESEDGLDVSFPLRAVERSFRCSLCSGYFREAVTLKDCLHTFCRWCLYSHVEAAETEEVCCPVCERNLLLAAPHRDGAGKDSRHYLPRVSAACVAAASSQTASSSSSSSSSAAAAANAAVLFDRTMQNVVDKLFPHFVEEERLEAEELRQYLLQHQHKELPQEYLVGALGPGPPGAPFRREGLAQRKARLEARAAAEGPLGPPPLEPQHSQEEQQQQDSADKAGGGTAVKHELREGVRSSRRSAAQQQQQQQQQQQPPLDEFVDQLLGAPSCFDEQQTMAIALLPDKYQGALLEARLQHQAAQSLPTLAGGPLGGPSLHDAERGPLAVPLPLHLPQLDRPYLRVPSRMTVQLVLRYLSQQLQPLLQSSSQAAAAAAAAGEGGSAEGFAARGGGAAEEEALDLETALELTLEGRVLGRSHSLEFISKARRLSCVGRCLLLQYRYAAQMETRVLASHLPPKGTWGGRWAPRPPGAPGVPPAALPPADTTHAG